MGLIPVAIALVLTKVLVQPGGELTAKGVIHQCQPQVIRVQPGDGGIHGADDRLGRSRPVHQIDGGGPVGRRDGCIAFG